MFLWHFIKYLFTFVKLIYFQPKMTKKRSKVWNISYPICIVDSLGDSTAIVQSDDKVVFEKYEEAMALKNNRLKKKTQ